MLGIYTENYGTMLRHTAVMDWAIFVVKCLPLMSFVKTTSSKVIVILHQRLVAAP